MNTGQHNKQIKISINLARYYALWLKVTFLKVVSLGLYAPWGNQILNDFLLSNSSCNEKNFKILPAAIRVFKVRVLFVVVLAIVMFLSQLLPSYSLVFQLLLLIGLPGFYLTEKSYEFRSQSIEEKRSGSAQLLVGFYKNMTLPMSLFILFSIVIFNNDLIDSQFLASIDTKEDASIYSEDSYLARTENELMNSEHDHLTGGVEHLSHGESWGGDISQEEIAYLEEHEKSHNHGSISLSRLQKYQIAGTGNQFLQFFLMCLLICFLWPWVDYRMIEHRIKYSNLLGGHWTMRKGIVSLYRLYLKVLVVIFTAVALSGLMLLILLQGSEGSSPEFWSNLLANSLGLLPLIIILFFFSFSLLFLWRKQWLLDNLVSEAINTEYEVSYTTALYLAITNTVVIFFTLGFALPWCRLRTYRYLANRWTLNYRM